MSDEPDELLEMEARLRPRFGCLPVAAAGLEEDSSMASGAADVLAPSRALARAARMASAVPGLWVRRGGGQQVLSGAKRRAEAYIIVVLAEAQCQGPFEF